LPDRNQDRAVVEKLGASSQHFPKKVGKGNRDIASIKEPFADNRYGQYRWTHESVVVNAPDGSGIYGIYNTFWIYVGEADDMRSRLLQHLAGDNQCISFQQPTGFAFELVPVKERAARLKEILTDLEPVCNRSRVVS
jgi:hypothetical protein